MYFRCKYRSCQAGGWQEMAKSARKKAKRAVSPKIPKKLKEATKGETKLSKNVECLLELHKLQGALLTQLCKEIC